jgi:tRNA(Arg) A34 adenosine deaminase TadA
MTNIYTNCIKDDEIQKFINSSLSNRTETKPLHVAVIFNNRTKEVISCGENVHMRQSCDNTIGNNGPFTQHAEISALKAMAQRYKNTRLPKKQTKRFFNYVFF